MPISPSHFARLYPPSSVIAVPLPLLQAKPRSQVPRCYRNQSRAAEEEAFVQLFPFFLKKTPLFPPSHHLPPSSSFFLVLPQTEARQTYDHGSTEESKSVWVGALLTEKDGVGGSGFRPGFLLPSVEKFVAVQEIGSLFSWTKTNAPIGRTGNFRDSRTLELRTVHGQECRLKSEG